jgi:hypothetical protein
MDELLSLGMSNSSQALLSGCSAGGLAILIHCDEFRQLFPKDTNVKCLADAEKILLEIPQSRLFIVMLFPSRFFFTKLRFLPFNFYLNDHCFS